MIQKWFLFITDSGTQLPADNVAAHHLPLIKKVISKDEDSVHVF